MKTPTISLRDGGGGATERGSPEHALYPAQNQPRAHAVRPPELWKLVLEGKHQVDCDCEVCMRLRVEENR